MRVLTAFTYQRREQFICLQNLAQEIVTFVLDRRRRPGA